MVNRPQTSIVGYGETAFGEIPDLNHHEINQKAAYSAISNAGLTPDEIDGIILSHPLGGNHFDMGASIAATDMAEYLGIAPSFSYGSTLAVDGAGQIQFLAQADHAIRNNMCNNVLVLGGSNFLSRLGRNHAVESLADLAHDEFERPYGPITPSLYALPARRHMTEYGTTRELLAQLTELHYKHASRQPAWRSHTHEERSVEAILDSPTIADPLTIDMCALISDGAAAYVITDRDNATEKNDDRVDIKGVGTQYTNQYIHQTPDLTESEAGKAADKAFEQADVTHDDLDVITIYDAFASVVLCMLEDLGFAEKGEVGDLVASGAFEVDGKWPLNTHGGELAQGHPGAAGGIVHVTEAVRQLRGEGGKTQVDGAETAMVHTQGGVHSVHGVTILQRGDS